MAKYNVPIERKVLDIYQVEARSGSDAAFQAALLVSEGNPPTSTRELSRRVLSARPAVSEPTTPTQED